MKAVWAIVGVGFALAAAIGATGTAAPDAATVAVDRTLSCATAAQGGVRELRLRANAGFRQGRTPEILAFAVVSTGPVTGVFTPVDDSFAWVAAGTYDRQTNLTATDGRGNVSNVASLGTWALNNRLCRPAKVRVPLSGRGLRALEPDALGVDYDCVVPARVLVRVRIVSAATPRRYREHEYEKTKSPLRQGFLAVRTQSGKPVAFASVFDSGRARLAVAPTCTED